MFGEATEIQFDGKSSSDFDLKLVSLTKESLGVANMGGIPLLIEEAKIKRNPKPLFFGAETGEKLKFTMILLHIPKDSHIQNDNKLTPQSLGAVSKWLFQREYKELKILNQDYSNIVFNCIMQNPQNVEGYGDIYGFSIDVICDRPYGIRKQSITKTVSSSLTFNLRNLGFETDYIKPEIEFTTSSSSMSIVNNTDDNNNFQFTGLNIGETVYVNNELGQIVSSTGLNRNQNFNFNWFKITPDYYNNITIVGNGTVTFRMEFPIPI